MNSRYFLRQAHVALICLLLSLSGCAHTDPSRFYALTSIGEPLTDQERSMVTSGPVIVVGPVKIPEYLKWPQIVTHTGENEIVRDEFHRWAGSLQENILRVLTENLSNLLPSDMVFSVHQATPLPARYRVMADILRLESRKGENVLLKARWTILDTQGEKKRLTRISAYNETISGDDYASLVAGMGRVFGHLSREITSVLSPMLHESSFSGTANE